MPRQIPVHMKAAIVTLHLFTDKSWNDISATLRVHPESARQIFQRAKERVGGSEDPLIILAGLANQKPIVRSNQTWRRGALIGSAGTSKGKADAEKRGAASCTDNGLRAGLRSLATGKPSSGFLATEEHAQMGFRGVLAYATMLGFEASPGVKYTWREDHGPAASGTSRIHLINHGHLLRQYIH